MTEQKQRREPIPGRYMGKLIDYGIGKTKAGDPQVLMVFDFTDAAGIQFQRIWFGSLKPGKAQEITQKALQTLGYVTGIDLAAIAEGVDSGVLNTSKKVLLTVADEADQNGNVHSRIQWINPIGGPAMDSRVNRQEAADLLNRSHGFWIPSTGFSQETLPTNGGQQHPDEVPF